MDEVRINRIKKHVFFSPSGILLTISGHPDLEKHCWMQIWTDIVWSRWLSSFETQAAKAKKIHECHLEVKFIGQAFKSALRKGVLEICSQRPLNLGSLMDVIK